MTKTKTKAQKYEINENAKPFYHDTGSDSAVLFIHGFTDSLGNTKKQSEDLVKMGISCMGVCLPGHGTHYTDLENYGPKDWVGCVEEALLKLGKHHKKIYIVGISVGGNLALHMAAKHPDKVDGVVCVATTGKIKHHNSIKVFAPIVSPFYKYHKREIYDNLRDNYLANGCYEYFPIMTGWKLINFVKKNGSELEKVKAPVLIFQVRNKKEAPADAAQYIYDQVSSDKKKIVEIFDYNFEKNKKNIFKIAVDFFELGKFDKDLKTIPDFFLETSKDFPEKEALLCKEGSRYVSLTYKELEDEVFHLAYELKKLGLEKGDNVVLISKNRPEWVISDLAIQLAGGVVVPIHEVLAGGQMANIIRDVEARVAIISGKGVLKKLREAKVDLQIISMDSVREKVDNFEEILKAKPKDFVEIKKEILVSLPEEKDLATIVYTSGTTGHFAGVLLTHKNIVTNINDVMVAIDLSENEKFLSVLPLSHILERTVGYYVPMAVGATISYIDDPLKLSEVAQKERPSIIIAVPRLYEKIYDKIILEVGESPIKKVIFGLALKIGGKRVNNRSFSMEVLFKIADKVVFKKIKDKFGGNIRFFVSGGAPLPKKVGEFFGNMGLLILEGYGLTETSPIVSCNTDRTGHNKFGTAGRVLPSVKVKVSKDGEILVKGPSVTSGYYDHGKTELAFTEDGWFKTGDLGGLDKDGFLTIKGRKKEVIVLSTGKNVLPVPIEEALEMCPYVKQSFVFGDGKKHIGAIIVPEVSELSKKFAGLSDDEIYESEDVRKFIDEEISKVQKGLSHYEQVKKYILISESFTIENHLLTPTLKLRRHLILEKYKEEIEGLYK
ncbi:hypothetical protein COY62_02390 [bacterium (Candidatus Howlettbacteria) CG_4_10_14_0_8_um_filter_40_9]|nr:MAG: hypothetical protein COY62_02390 [bacterium (Candidatus Howlettbacteria) CG_4_10_14_0_8_um_filter_40_9]